MDAPLSLILISFLVIHASSSGVDEVDNLEKLFNESGFGKVLEIGHSKPRTSYFLGLFQSNWALFWEFRMRYPVNGYPAVMTNIQMFEDDKRQMSDATVEFELLMPEVNPPFWKFWAKKEEEKVKLDCFQMQNQDYRVMGSGHVKKTVKFLRMLCQGIYFNYVSKTQVEIGYVEYDPKTIDPIKSKYYTVTYTIRGNSATRTQPRMVQNFKQSNYVPLCSLLQNAVDNYEKRIGITIPYDD